MGASASTSSPQPSHVALIMDGNRRWARARRQSHEAGYRAGMASAKKLIKHAGTLGIQTLTLFAFSSENSNRPRRQVDLLLRLFAEALSEQAQELLEKGARLRFIGDMQRFSPELQAQIEQIHAQASPEAHLTVCVAMHYGGRQDLTRAAVQCQKDGVAITQTHLSERLWTAGLPDPDLLIRTGGEYRLSNFLLWQMAYTECYFTKTLWPEFNEQEFDAALEWYARRDRRFGVESA